MRRLPFAQSLFPAELALQGLSGFGKNSSLSNILLSLCQESTAANTLGDDEECDQRDEHGQRALDDEQVEPLVVVSFHLEGAI